MKVRDPRKLWTPGAAAHADGNCGGRVSPTGDGGHYCELCEVEVIPLRRNGVWVRGAYVTGECPCP